MINNFPRKPKSLRALDRSIAAYDRLSRVSFAIAERNGISADTADEILHNITDEFVTSLTSLHDYNMFNAFFEAIRSHEKAAIKHEVAAANTTTED